jgi:hypothetical protein
MKNTMKFALLLVAAIAFAAACKPAGEKSSTTEASDKISEEEIKAGVEEVVFPLPEPMNVYQMLENIGASYVGAVLNPVESIEKYYSSNVKAANLGVYAADLSYATVYDRKDDIDAYSQSLKILIDDLGIKIDYKMLISEETKAKTENLDSLIELTTEVFYNTYEFLYKESDPALAALMVNGFYVEGLYIATHISEDTFNNTEMVKIIYDQSKPLEKLIELNGKFPENQYLETLQNALKKLKALYDETDGSLTKEQLKTLTTSIETIRNSIVA